MGKRGPQRAPIEQLKARGSWLAATREDDAPTADHGIPPYPFWLDDVAKPYYDVIAQAAHSIGVLGMTDAQMLGVCATSAHRFIEARALVEQTGGPVVTTPSGDTKRNPAVVAEEKHRAEFHRHLREFGLTPSARSDVKVISSDTGSADPQAEALAKLLN